MRIAMIGSKGVPAGMGGVERHVEALAVQLVDRGHDVTVYTRPWYTGVAAWSERTVRGVRTVALPSLATKHADAISHTLLATIHAMRARCDVYHFHGVGPALWSILPRCFRPRARVIVTFHCVDRRHAKWGRFARTILGLGEWVSCVAPHHTIAVSETLAAYCGDRYRRAVACIPNGVAEMPAVAPPEAARILAAWGLASRQYFLVVSRLVAHKGIATTIAAFRKLREEYPEHRTMRLVIVGDAAFTPEHAQELHVLAGGDPMIQFLGAQYGAALTVLYRSCAAFIHASRSEGLPIVILEAAAAGAVPVCSDIPEHREVVARIGGILFRVGDVHDLVVKLAVLLASQRSLPRIGDRIRSAVLRTYHWDQIGAATDALLRASPPSFRFAHG